jgi:hypothetical protein
MMLHHSTAAMHLAPLEPSLPSSKVAIPRVPTTFAWKRTTETSLHRVQRAENKMQPVIIFLRAERVYDPKILCSRPDSRLPTMLRLCMSTDLSKVIESYKSPFALEFHLARDRPDRVFIHLSTLLRPCQSQMTKKRSFAYLILPCHCSPRGSLSEFVPPLIVAEWVLACFRLFRLRRLDRHTLDASPPIDARQPTDASPSLDACLSFAARNSLLNNSLPE